MKKYPYHSDTGSDAMPRKRGRKVARDAPAGPPPPHKRRKRLSAEEKRAMLSLVESGTPRAQICRSFDVVPSTVTRLVQRARRRAAGVMDSRPARPVGRPRLLDARGLRSLRRSVLAAPHDSLATYSRALASVIGASLSTPSVGRYLRRCGMRTYRVARKPLTSERNRRLRLAWANAHLGWSVADWRRVLFTDETTIELRSECHKVFVHAPRGRRLDARNTAKSVKFAQKAMYWGGFCYGGTTDLLHLNGNVNAAVCVQDRSA